MKLSRITLAVMPAVMGMAQLAFAGPFCGGCSDPCGPRGHGRLFGHHHAGYGYAAVSPAASCGYVAAQPQYAPAAPMQYAPLEQCAAPATSTYYGPGTITADGGFAMSVAPATESLCEPVTGYRVVMEPQFVTETVAQPTTETQTETRYRVKTVNKTVPVKQQNYRVKTVMKPVSETKTVEYTVLVPETTQKTVDVTVSVPVWNEVSETYTIKVPEVVDLPEEYTVRVPTLRDEQFTYTVYVPETHTVTKTQTVSNAVPVTKTRTVQRCVPVYSTKTVQKDYGHWETIVDEVAPAIEAAPVTTCAGSAYTGYGCGSSVPACGGCATTPSCGCSSPAPACSSPASSCGCASAAVSGCGSNLGCGSNAVAYSAPAAAPCNQVRTATRRVWVPNVVTEEVPVVTSQMTTDEVAYTVYEQQSEVVSYDCTYLVYKPQERTGTRKVVDYVEEKRTRNRQVVNYRDETRTRTRKVMSYKTETKTETFPYVSYKTEKRTKDVSFTMQVPEQIVEPYEETTYQQVSEQVVEEYQVQVEVCTTKEAQVQVMRMVPKLVPYTYSPCSSSTSNGTYSVSGCSAAAGGCGSTGYSVGGYDTGAVSGCGCSVQPAVTAPCCGQ